MTGSVRVAGILVCIMFFGQVAVVKAADPTPWETATAAVGYLYARHPNYAMRGSFVVVGTGRVLITATHVVEGVDSRQITCHVQGKVFHPALVVSAPNPDITLMVPPRGIDLKGVDLYPKEEPLSAGMDITAIGFSGNPPLCKVMSGSLDDLSSAHFLRKKRGRLDSMVISQHVKLGMSGGGAFSADGKLIGIITARLTLYRPVFAVKGLIFPVRQPGEEK